MFIVNTAGTVEWEYPAKNCNDLWVLPGGNLLFNTGHGVQEVTREKKVVFDYQSKSEIYACQRLDNGNTFIGECNAGRLLEVDPAGKIVKEIRLLPEGKDGLVVNIIDQRVWRLTPRFFSYTLSKSALWTATRTMAQGFAPRVLRSPPHARFAHGGGAVSFLSISDTGYPRLTLASLTAAAPTLTRFVPPSLRRLTLASLTAAAPRESST